MRVWDSLLAAQLSQTVELYNIANLAAWLPLGSGALAGYLWPDLNNADGDVAAGLFAPLGDYGLLAVPVRSKP